MGGGTVTGVDAEEGMAGKGLDTRDTAVGSESRTRGQQEASELHSAQN